MTFFRLHNSIALLAVLLTAAPVAQAQTRTGQPQSQRPARATPKADAPLDIVIGEPDSPPAASSAQSPENTALAARAEQKMDDAVRKAEDRARTVQGVDALVVRLQVTSLRRLRNETVSYEVARASISEEGAFDVGRLKSQQELDARIRKFEQLQRTGSDLRRALESLPNLYAQEMRSSGANEAAIPEAVAATSQLVDLERQIQEQKAVEEMCTAAIAQLKILKRTWGQWKPSNGQVEFAQSVSDSDKRALMEYGQQMHSSLTRIAQLRKAAKAE